MSPEEDDSERSSRVKREMWHDAPLLLTPLYSNLTDSRSKHYYMKNGAVWIGNLRCPLSPNIDEESYLGLQDFFR